MIARTVDARGLSCPLPIVQLALEVKSAQAGEEVAVMADDQAFPSDVTAWCKKTKNLLVGLEPVAGGYFRAVVRKVVQP